MKKTILLSLAVVIFSSAFGGPVSTKIRIRAVSRDAKILGDKVNGALITVTSLETGEILARGTQLGGTGDTELIMVRPRERFGRVYDTEGAAYFEATLMLEKPTWVEISAEGPLGFPDARARSSKSMVLLPGQDIGGEGVLLELHGFIVRVVSPEQGSRFVVGEPVGVKALLNLT